MRRDPVLADVIRTVGPCRWGEGTPDLFAGIVRAIASQQLSVKAADTILGRVLQLLPDQRIDPATLQHIPVPALRAAGLSNRKAEYLRDVAARFHSGEFRADDFPRLSDDEVIETLTRIRGIGRWSAEMVLMFRLHRPDVLPLDDVGLLRAVQRVYGMKRRPTPKQLTRLGEAWRPWRTVACWYLWGSLDVEPKIAAAAPPVERPRRVAKSTRKAVSADRRPARARPKA